MEHHLRWCYDFGFKYPAFPVFVCLFGVTFRAFSYRMEDLEGGTVHLGRDQRLPEEKCEPKSPGGACD